MLSIINKNRFKTTCPDLRSKIIVQPSSHLPCSLERQKDRSKRCWSKRSIAITSYVSYDEYLKYCAIFSSNPTQNIWKRAYQLYLNIYYKKHTPKSLQLMYIKGSNFSLFYGRNFCDCVQKPAQVRTSTGFGPVNSRSRCDVLTN